MTLPPEALDLPQRLLDQAKLLRDRHSILPLLPKNAVFVEVGVGYGGFSQLVLDQCDPALFIAIDNFALDQLPAFWGRPTEECWDGLSHLDYYKARFASPIAAKTMKVIQAESTAGLMQLDDRSVDVIYLDADHRYEYVKPDLAAARLKIKLDGWIILNDYIMVSELHSDCPYGVVHAAHEFMIEHDWGMQYLALQTRMFCDVVLRPSAILTDEAAWHAAAQSQAPRLQAEIEALHASHSWRLTAPLRALSRAAGRG